MKSNHWIETFTPMHVPALRASSVFLILPRAHALSLPKFLREMDVHILSLRSRRQHKAWSGALAELQEDSVGAHQAREVGDSSWSGAISSSLMPMAVARFAGLRDNSGFDLEFR